MRASSHPIDGAAAADFIHRRRRASPALVFLLALGDAAGCASSATGPRGNVSGSGSAAEATGSSGSAGASAGGSGASTRDGQSSSDTSSASGDSGQSSGSVEGDTGVGSAGAGGGGSSSGGSAGSGSAAVGDGGGLDLPPPATRGASLPYFEYEAEDSTAASVTGGTVLKWADPTTNPENSGAPLNTFEALEASGRSAVRLDGAGQSISFTLKHRASSIVVRYSIPDSSSGNPQAVVGADNNATLGLYVNGRRQDLRLTSRYSWTYGSLSALDSPSISNQTPGGDPHHLYDEVRAMFPEEVPAGTIVKLQQDSQDTAAFYVIDLVDFEDVGPPLAQPVGSISITDSLYGATPNDGTDDSAAILKAIADATGQHKVLWIPVERSRWPLPHPTCRISSTMPGRSCFSRTASPSEGRGCGTRRSRASARSSS